MAGLGGEPDYEQRFTMLATDIDKILHTGAQTDRVVETLKGADATKAKMEGVLNRFAAQAKPPDAFVADADWPWDFRWRRSTNSICRARISRAQNWRRF